MHAIVPYNPDDSSSSFASYYDEQIGHGLSVYVGKQHMSGNGIGSVFSGLFRSALPLIKKGAVNVGKRLLKEGVGVLGDVASGQSFKESTKKRIRSVGKNLLGDVKQAIKAPSPRQAVTSSRKRKGSRIKASSKRSRTIFD